MCLSVYGLGSRVNSVEFGWFDFPTVFQPPVSILAVAQRLRFTRYRDAKLVNQLRVPGSEFPQKWHVHFDKFSRKGALT